MLIYYWQGWFDVLLLLEKCQDWDDCFEYIFLLVKNVIWKINLLIPGYLKRHPWFSSFWFIYGSVFGKVVAEFIDTFLLATYSHLKLKLKNFPHMLPDNDRFLIKVNCWFGQFQTMTLLLNYSGILVDLIYC